MGSVQELRETLNRMVNDLYSTPEEIHFCSFPLTVERAKVLAVHRVHYTINRRDCWGAVQSRAPIDVKRLVWEHEKEELICDPRFGGDHITASIQKASRLTGMAEEEILTTELIPGCKAAFRAWLDLARDSSWLKALSASAILERENSNRIVKGGAGSVRNSRRETEELRRIVSDVPGHDVHNVADDDHCDMMEIVLDRYATTAEAQRQVLEGAKDSMDFTRAFKGALAVVMEKIAG
jgi:hypothetical protein